MKGVLQLQNLKCQGCEMTILHRLKLLDDVSKVMVDETNATVSFDYNKIDDLEKVKKELTYLGYPPVGHKNDFLTKTKSFISCAKGRIKN